MPNTEAADFGVVVSILPSCLSIARTTDTWSFFTASESAVLDSGPGVFTSQMPSRS